MKTFLETIIKQAGAISLEYKTRLGEVQITRKGTVKDLVTEADVAVEEFLVAQIRRAYPDHAICGEESGAHAGDRYRWIIDPIDGTTSFVHNLPFYSISIALECDGQTVLSAVYAPVLDELFMAERGHGATLNNAPIRVSDRSALSDCVLATGFACLRANLERNNIPLISRIAPTLRGLRVLGSAALDQCYVACGRIDGVWELNLNIYDIVAGALIAEEAGATVTDFSGTGTQNLPAEILTTNTKIHNELTKLLNQCEPG